MRAVIQRVSEASVKVDGQVIGAIEQGYLVLLGVEAGDTDKEAVYMADKIAGIRLFEDEEGKMNLALSEVGGSILAVSQFTLLGDARKGRRPSYSTAARPEEANTLYEHFVQSLRAQGFTVATGQFQADMKVSLVNDGPVTILLDSKKLF